MKSHLIFSILVLAWISNSNALINGKPLRETPDVVRIVFDNGWMCSGLFVDRYTILTASHCLNPPEPGKPAKVYKILSTNDHSVLVEVLESKQHPLYSGQWWPAYDIGLIKTTENRNFKGEFSLENKTKKSNGRIFLFGTGKYDLEKNLRARSMGENSFFSIGAVLFFFGKTQSISENLGTDTTVAPNDSGGPVVDSETHKIIGVITSTTLQQSIKYNLPALSAATSTTNKENHEFIVNNLGPTTSAFTK